MHASAITRQLDEPGESRCLDLGTGSGLPGLVMATCWPATRWLLIDRRLRSESFARWAIGLLDLSERVSFRRGEAAELAREVALAGAFALVVARAFGPPPLTAECATGFLGLRGRLVVSEPESGSEARWPSEPLRRLGLELHTTGTEPCFVELRKVTPHEDRFPRRPAAMQRNPLY
ncbi:MAG: class I SAM-dependent methyltransferase [Acidimicrobiia bacterium]|nr:class I SAM-dependent methyltransferase [Acidimicrobiia bacterium]